MNTAVIDASVVVNATSNVVSTRVADILRSTTLHGPPHLPVEVDSALRRLEHSGRHTSVRVSEMREVARALPVRIWPWENVADRAWELRHNLTIYDAAYVALAERIGAVLLTGDRRMATAPGIRCAVEVL